MGQFLFWQHLSHTADHAALITAIAAPVYIFTYRNLIRAYERVSWLGKLLIGLSAACFVGVNSMLAAHEIVILYFKPQVTSQMSTDQSKAVIEYKSLSETALGLPTLRTEQNNVTTNLNDAREQRMKIPDTATSAQRQADGCDAIAATLQSRIPDDPDTLGYQSARAVWLGQRSRCNESRALARKLQREHNKYWDDQIASLNQSAAQLKQSVNTANNTFNQRVADNTPALEQGVSTGFARHHALWSAVTSGLIPAWAAYGLVTIVMLVEAMGFILKFLLPLDEVGSECLIERKRIEAETEMKLAYTKEYRDTIHQVLATDLKPDIENEVKQDFKNIIIPSMRVDTAARAFDQAHQHVADAQTRWKKPAPELLHQLAGLAREVRGRMNASPAGSSS